MCHGLSVIFSSCISLATSYSVIAIAKSILFAKNNTGTSRILIAMGEMLVGIKTYKDDQAVLQVRFVQLKFSVYQQHQLRI